MEFRKVGLWKPPRYSLLRSNLNVLVRALSDSHSEHIGKAGGLVRFPRIVPIHRLVDVPLEVRLGHEMVGAEHNPLEIRPEAFNRVGRDTTLGELPDVVPDNPVRVALFVQVRVDVGLVREHGRAFSHELLDDGHKGL